MGLVVFVAGEGRQWLWGDEEVDVLVGAGQAHPAPVGYSILDWMFDGVEEGDGVVGLLRHGHGVVDDEA